MCGGKQLVEAGPQLKARRQLPQQPLPLRKLKTTASRQDGGVVLFVEAACGGRRATRRRKWVVMRLLHPTPTPGRRLEPPPPTRELTRNTASKTDTALFGVQLAGPPVCRLIPDRHLLSCGAPVDS